MSATYAMNQTMSLTVRVVRVQTSAEKKRKKTAIMQDTPAGIRICTVTPKIVTFDHTTREKRPKQKKRKQQVRG
jgi:hypothetical protein